MSGKGRRNRKKKNAINSNPQFNATVQTLGRGSTRRIVTKEMDISSAGTDSHVLAAVMSDSTEFQAMAVQYRYMKLEKVQVTIIPSVGGSTAALIKPYSILMLWTDDSNGTTNIIEDDSTVLVQPVGYRPVTRTFLPPNCQMFISSGLSSLNGLNPRHWVVIDDLRYVEDTSIRYHFPGSLKIKHPSLGAYRLSLYIQFRGSKIASVATAAALLKIYSKAEVPKKEDTKEGDEQDLVSEESQKWNP